MSAENIKKDDSDDESLKILLNPSIQPMFVDQVFKVEVNDNNSIAKLFLGHQIDDRLFHSSTIVLPLNSLLELNKVLSSDRFQKDIRTDD